MLADQTWSCTLLSYCSFAGGWGFCCYSLFCAEEPMWGGECYSVCVCVCVVCECVCAAHSVCAELCVCLCTAVRILLALPPHIPSSCNTLLSISYFILPFHTPCFLPALPPPHPILPPPHPLLPIPLLPIPLLPIPLLPPSLTVAQVNQYLDDLANGNTSKDRAGMKKALQLLLRNTSALEQKWLIRIILKVAAHVGGGQSRRDQGPSVQPLRLWVYMCMLFLHSNFTPPHSHSLPLCSKLCYKYFVVC